MFTLTEEVAADIDRRRQLSAQVRKWGARKYDVKPKEMIQPANTSQTNAEDTNPPPGNRDTSALADAPQVRSSQLTDLGGMNTRAEPIEAAVRGRPLMLYNENEQSFGSLEPDQSFENPHFDYPFEGLNFDFNDLHSFGTLPTTFDNQGVGEAEVGYGLHNEEVPDWHAWDNRPGG